MSREFARDGVGEARADHVLDAGVRRELERQVARGHDLGRRHRQVDGHRGPEAGEVQRVDVGGRRLVDDDLAQSGPVEHVGIVARPAREGLIPRADHEGVVAGAGVDRVVAAARGQAVEDIGAVAQVGHRAGVGVVVEGVGAGPGRHGVGAGAGPEVVEGVGPVAQVDDVGRPRVVVEGVGAGPRRDGVADRPGAEVVEGVVAVAGGDGVRGDAAAEVVEGVGAGAQVDVAPPPE